MENELWTLTQFDAQNGAALQTLINQHQVQMIEFPEAVLSALRKLAEDVLEEEAAKSPMAKKVNESFKKFRKILVLGAASRNRPITIVSCLKHRHVTS